MIDDMPRSTPVSILDTDQLIEEVGLSVDVAIICAGIVYFGHIAAMQTPMVSLRDSRFAVVAGGMELDEMYERAVGIPGSVQINLLQAQAIFEFTPESPSYDE